MRRLTFRLAVALLTFVVGITAVSFWFFLRWDTHEKRGQSALSTNELAINLAEEESLYINGPAAQWIYISDPLVSCGMSWVYGDIIIFYQNGEWGKVTACLVHIGKRWQVQWPYGYVSQTGRWSEVNGEIAVSIEGHYFSCMSELPEEKISYPIVENWRATKGRKGDEDSTFVVSKHRFKRISADKFIDVNMLLNAPREVERYKTSCCGGCS